MLSAKQARENTDKNKVANFKSEIEKTIKRTIDKGRDEMRIMGTVPAEIITELREKGYKVEELKGITKISW